MKMNCFYRRQEILLCLPLAQRAKQLQLEMKFTRNRKEKKAFTIKGECIKQVSSIDSASWRGTKFDSISYFISMNDCPPLFIYHPYLFPMLSVKRASSI